MVKQSRVRPIKDKEKKAAIPDEIIKPNDNTHNPHFKLEVAEGNLTEALNFLKNEIGTLVKRGRYHKIRIKRHGKAVLPDIPVGAFAALEAATFLKTGPLRLLFANVLGKTFFEVELINEAHEAYHEGIKLYLLGEIDDAISMLEKALSIEDDYPQARLQLGIAYRVKGNKTQAIAEFQQVIETAKDSKMIDEAKRQLDIL